MNECGKILDKNKFVFAWWGTFCLSRIFASLSEKMNPKEVTILQIDAHCDLRDTDADYNENPSKLAHSCVLRARTNSAIIWSKSAYVLILLVNMNIFLILKIISKF